MHFSHISLANFKNYEQVQLSFDKRINLIYGANGSGKTNLLDALHYFSWGKSYFSIPDKGILRENEQWMRMEATIIDNNDQKNDIVIKYKSPASKSIEINHQKLAKVSELVGLHPVVLIAPNDIKLVYDGSKERRDVVDRILSQCDADYLEHLIRYNRYHAQKHAHLKGKDAIDPMLLESYNEKLIAHGEPIFQKRSQFVADFFPSVADNYQRIAKSDESIGWSYQSNYQVENIASEYAKVLSNEILARRVLIGIHRDDFVYSIRSLPLKKYGSQGQIKSYLYALRLAEYEYLYDQLGKKPVLILDDFFEKLDRNRLEQLIVLINDNRFDQIFLSDTELERSKSIFVERGVDYAAFRVVGGKIEAVKE